MEDNLPICPICPAIEIKYDDDGRYPDSKHLLTFSKEKFNQLLRQKLSASINPALQSPLPNSLYANLANQADQIALKYEKSDLANKVSVLLLFVYAYDEIRVLIEKTLETKLQEQTAQQERENQRHQSFVNRKKQKLSVNEVKKMHEQYEQLMKDLGEQPTASKTPSAQKKPQSKQKDTKHLAPPTAPAPPPAIESKTSNSKDEAERQKKLAAFHAQNEAKKVAQIERKKKLAKKRTQSKQEEKVIASFLTRRAQTTIDKQYSSYLQLTSCGKIDPAIFDGDPDLEKDVIPELEAGGVSVRLRVHNNESSVAMWKDSTGEKHMCWFHSPHKGTRDGKGEDAGWVRSIEHDLLETGMLAPKKPKKE